MCSKIENEKLTKIVKAVHLRCMSPAISLLQALKKYHKNVRLNCLPGSRDAKHCPRYVFNDFQYFVHFFNDLLL